MMVAAELHPGTHPSQAPLLASPGQVPLMGPPPLVGDGHAILPSPVPGVPPPIPVAMAATPLIIGGPPEMGFQGTLIVPPEEEGPVWLEHTTNDGQVYYSNPSTKRTTWEKPFGARIVPFNHPDQSIPLGASGGMGGGPPVPAGVPLVSQRVWSEHHTPEGKVYYYNKVTRQSVWEKPKDFELVMPLPSNLSGDPQKIEPAAAATGSPPSTNNSTIATTAGLPPSSIAPPTIQYTTPTIQPIVSPDQPKPLLSTPFATAPNQALPVSSLLLGNENKNEPEPMEPSQKELLALVAAKLGTGPPPAPPPKVPIKVEEKKGPRPIESTPVPGTPWSIVFTSDGKQFFFDATNHKSIWKTPPDLLNNPTVQRVLENPPWKKKRVGELVEPPSKRMKLAALVGEEEEMEREEEKIVIPETKMEGIEVDLSAAVKAEVAERNRELKAAELRAVLPLEERQEMFKAMLLERGVSAFSTWEKELPKFVFDERYQLLLVKERKTAFDEFIATRVEEEMKEKKLKVKEKKDTFLKFLQECKITSRTTFTEFIRQHARDEKFKVIDKMKERETLFNEYISELKKMTKQRDEEQKQAHKSKTEKEKTDFMAMLKEEEKLNESSQWRKVKSWFQKDRRYKAIDSSSTRETLFKEYIASLNRDEKQELIAASLREREREVQLSRSAQEKQWDMEREQLRRTEAQQHFSSLLVDLIKDPLSSWTESKRQLKRDQRWEMAELIDIAEREKMFRDHVSQLAKKRRLQFRKLLEETPKITLKMTWKKARKYIKEDIRYKNFSDNDHDREDEYERYLHDKMVQTKEDFKALLQETKMLTHKTRDTVRSSERHLKDIIETLKNDRRYLILDCIEEERQTILMDYIEELHQKGPPPPPTATNPTERLRK